MAVALGIITAVAYEHLKDDTPLPRTPKTTTSPDAARATVEEGATARINRVVIVRDSNAAFRDLTKGRVSLNYIKALL